MPAYEFSGQYSSAALSHWAGLNVQARRCSQVLPRCMVRPHPWPRLGSAELLWVVRAPAAWGVESVMVSVWSACSCSHSTERRQSTGLLARAKQIAFSYIYYSLREGEGKFNLTRLSLSPFLQRWSKRSQLLWALSGGLSHTWMQSLRQEKMPANPVLWICFESWWFTLSHPSTHLFLNVYPL